MTRHTYTVRLEDVGKRILSIGGTNHFLKDSIGYILRRDVGKRIYIRDSHLSMENDEQHKARLKV